MSTGLCWISRSITARLKNKHQAHETDFIHQLCSLTTSVTVKYEKWHLRRVRRVYLCVLAYICVHPRPPSFVSTSQCLSIHLHAGTCARTPLCVCLHMCTCAVSVCVSFIQVKQPHLPLSQFEWKSKKALVVITVINDFFLPFRRWKVLWPHPPFPARLDMECFFPLCSVRRSPCLCSNGCYTMFSFSTIGSFMCSASPGCVQ